MYPEDPLEKEIATTPVFLPGESYGHISLAGSSPWGPKESDRTEPLTHNTMVESCSDMAEASTIL